MKLADILPILQNLIGDDVKINQAYLARALGLTNATISDRIKRNSELTLSEMRQIEKYSGLDIYVFVNDKNFSIVKNSKERNFNPDYGERSRLFPKRLSEEIQLKFNFLNSEMACLLKISESDYQKLLEGEIKPDFNILNNIKQNFTVSIDWLLYGE